MYLCKWGVKRAAAKPHIAQQTIYPRLEKSLAPGHCIVNHCMCILYVHIHRYKRTHNELHYSKTLDDIARAGVNYAHNIRVHSSAIYVGPPLSLFHVNHYSARACVYLHKTRHFISFYCMWIYISLSSAVVDPPD